MAECNWCEAEKWFFQLSRSGVCADCAPEVQEFQKLLGEPLPEFGENNATVLLRLQQRVEAFIEEAKPS